MNVHRSDIATAGSLVGLIPAAGHATRLGNQSGSKELLAVWRPAGTRRREALPAIRCLLSSFEAAAVKRTLLVIRNGKEDIPASLGTMTRAGMRLEYVGVEDTPAPPFTLDAAIPRISEETVVMGFPDILFEPLGAVRQVLARLRRAEADVVLGLFPHPRVRRADVVQLKADGSVREVERAGKAGAAAWTWALAAWRPRFTRFLHGYVAGLDTMDMDGRSLGVGDVVTAAIAKGLTVRGEVVSDVPFLDIGTPEALAEAYRKLEES
ncbi:MAG: dTDP-glucose pyrophosphorylase [Gemmatimonadetes bacterium]|nr:dTDP-glucose pyrophosphorylase [Gemmatimonadota bacterium]